MKRHVHIVRPIALIAIGLLLAITSAALGQPVLIGASPGAASLAQTTPVPPAVSEVGSTDGLTLASIIICLIIIVPILIRHKSWNH